MFRKTILAIICLCGLFYSVGFAAELTLELNFPKPSTAKVTAVKPIPQPQEVSGNLSVDIAPYPVTAEKDRYLVEYYLNDRFIFSTSGFDAARPNKLSFGYTLNTANYDNGKYKLIVNFWDGKGPSAIGIKEIVINNKKQNA